MFQTSDLKVGDVGKHSKYEWSWKVLVLPSEEYRRLTVLTPQQQRSTFPIIDDKLPNVFQVVLRDGVEIWRQPEEPTPID